MVNTVMLSDCPWSKTTYLLIQMCNSSCGHSYFCLSHICHILLLYLSGNTACIFLPVWILSNNYCAMWLVCSAGMCTLRFPSACLFVCDYVHTSCSITIFRMRWLHEITGTCQDNCLCLERLFFFVCPFFVTKADF